MQRTILAVSIAVAVLAATFLLWRWIDIQGTDIRNRAVQECNEIAVAAGTPDQPYNGATYAICMADKGYNASVQ